MKRIPIYRYFFALLPISLLIFVGNTLAEKDDLPLPEKNLVVMNLAAHPDDEDGQTLAYYRWAKQATAYSVIYTRGEGGQNEIGTELYEELGALRTKETETAARILGTKVYFLNYKDFGYSKFAKEAFDTWGGEDSVTARIVYLVRKLKPDVMFTNHDTVTVGQRQHGQHQAVGISAYNAFELASNPSYHPEQLEEEGVDLWQPQRLFLRYWRESSTADVTVPVGDIYQSKNQSYQEIAMEALKQHASQGMGMFSSWNRPKFTYFQLLRSSTRKPLDERDLAGNLETSPRIASLNYYIDAAYLPSPKNNRFQLSDSIAVPNQTIRLKTLDKIDGKLTLWYNGKKVPLISDTFKIPRQALPTYPKVTHQYNRFENNYPFAYTIVKNDSITEAGYLKLEIAPPLEIIETDDVIRLRSGSNSLSFKAKLFDKTISTVDIRATVRHGQTNLFQTAISLPNERDISREIVAMLPEALPDGNYQIVYEVETTSSLSGNFRRTQIQEARIFHPIIDQNLHVGIIKSYDDTMEESMQALNVHYTLLDSLDLAQGDFKDIDTIVIDIRAYLVREDLREYNDKLLAWVKDGGNLIVNYQKTFEWNQGNTDPFNSEKKIDSSFAPYEIQLGRERVTFEDAPVRLLQPQNTLFKYPNKIEKDDWDGWIQERGLYFPNKYDSRYTELFEMNDPGESPLRSSTLYTTYGNGSYIYTALGWYRQLKALHPGAFKMFANMLSLSKQDSKP